MLGYDLVINKLWLRGTPHHYAKAILGYRQFAWHSERARLPGLFFGEATSNELATQADDGIIPNEEKFQFIIYSRELSPKRHSLRISGASSCI